MSESDKTFHSLRARIAELTAEAAQWQKSCRQNHVRATEAEHLCDRADEIMARYKHEAEVDEARIADLLTTIRAADGYLEMGMRELAQDVLRKALEK